MQGFKSSNAFTVRMIMLFSEIEVKNSESKIYITLGIRGAKDAPLPITPTIVSH